jgi:N-acetylmuramoyl-L-alanine amidase
LLRIRDVPSPNHEARPEGAVIDTLVLHYTGMRSGAEAIARLCDPAAKVSAHYVVEEDGAVFRLVAEERRAAHAGISHWRGRSALNGNSIGIEIVNPGHEWGYRPFPALQMAAVCDLCLEIMGRHPIDPRNVVAHSDIAPDRKQDPGELFDWQGLAANGVGLWPAAALAWRHWLSHRFAAFRFADSVSAPLAVRACRWDCGCRDAGEGGGGGKRIRLNACATPPISLISSRITRA